MQQHVIIVFSKKSKLKLYLQYYGNCIQITERGSEAGKQRESLDDFVLTSVLMMDRNGRWGDG